MSDETPRLKLAQLVSLQELNNVTWNEALAQLDALVDLCLLGQFSNTPPASPQDGDAYLIGGNPTGAWSGYAYKIAACLDGAWRFYMPFNGLRAYVVTTGAFIVYLGGTWTDCNSLLSANETAIASAAICDLSAAGALFVQITGTTAITSFGTGANKLRFVRFAQALTLTHNAATLILLGGASRTTAAGDVGIYASDASGNWRERSYFRAAANAGDAATKSGTETLANKTLSSPAFSGTATNFRSTGIADSATGVAITLTTQNINGSSYNFLGLNTPSPLGPLHITTNSTAMDTSYWTDTNPADPRTWRIGPGVGGNGHWGFFDGNSSVFFLDSSATGRAVKPASDNVQNLGTSSNRWATVYAGTGAINTSGAATKTNVRPLSGAEIAAAKALAANLRIFQFCDAVVKKGESARLHAGMIYEDVVAAFAAQGLDPLRYGIVCRDPATKTVTRTRIVRRPKTQSVTVERKQIAVANGVATLTTVGEMREEPVLQAYPLVEANGAPVIDPATAEPCVHFEPVADDVEETYEEVQPDLDEAGARKWVLGLRYAELIQFVMAGLAARLDALEAR